MTTEILYYIFIFPLESLLGTLYNSLYGLCGSYGVSIILLSLLVNIFLLKLTSLFDKKSKSFESLKKQCDKKVQEFKRVFKGAELQAYIRTLYKQKHFHPIYALQGLGGLALQVPFFLGVLFLFQNLKALKEATFLGFTLGSEDCLLFGFNLLPLVMCALSVWSVLISFKSKSQRTQGIFISLIFLALLYKMPSALVLYWSTNMLFSLCRIYILRYKGHFHTQNKALIFKSYVSQRLSKLFAKIPLKLSSKLNTLFVPYATLDSQSYLLLRNISIFAIINSCLMIFLFSPLAIYSSDIGQFESHQAFIVIAALFGSCILTCCVAVYAVSFLFSTRFLKILSIILSTILALGVIYTFILPGNYGALDHLVLENPTFLDRQTRIQRYLIFNVILLLAFGACFLLLKRLIYIWKILFVVLVRMSLYSFYDIYKQRQSLSHIADSQKAQGYAKNTLEDELFSYAKNHKNIVILVLDTFSGSHIPYILEQFPEFKRTLDGFTFFPNSVTTTNSTIHSIATLIGGEYYSVYNMNARDVNLAKEITKAFGEMGLNFANNGYEVSYFLSATGEESKEVAEYAQNKIFAIKYTDIDDLFQEQYNKRVFSTQAESSIGFEVKLLISLGLFRFVPEAYRKKVYNYGAWLFRRYTFMDYIWASKYTSSFYAFTHIHNANATKPTFKYLHSFMTHPPYATYYDNGKCSYESDKSVFEEYPHKVKMQIDKQWSDDGSKQSYDTEVCSFVFLRDYIDWLKNEGIYNNTQIFIVSDHGGNASINIHKYRADALLLFKDFNIRGELKIDERLMANYDMASIFCENLPQGCPNIPQHILKHYPQNREIIHTAPISWNLKQHKPNEWLINEYWKVKGEITNKQNWQDITQEVKDGRVNITGFH